MNRKFLLIPLTLASIAFGQSTTPAGSEKTQPKSGQTTPPASANPATTSGASEKSQTPNATGQPTTPPSSGQTPTPAPSQPSKPAHRTPPAAKSQEEFNAFQQISNMPDSAAAEKAADDFAQKF